ncbi:uncharacterized protein [Euphorbia lathyris]|uniref:uncharacterized protein isoform X2 n=1 Tax=Euphorbia lathyris TaxID=212925 RepID=UPI003313C89C
MLLFFLSPLPLFRFGHHNGRKNLQLNLFFSSALSPLVPLWSCFLHHCYISSVLEFWPVLLLLRRCFPSLHPAGLFAQPGTNSGLDLIKEESMGNSSGQSNRICWGIRESEQVILGGAYLCSFRPNTNFGALDFWYINGNDAQREKLEAIIVCLLREAWKDREVVVFVLDVVAEGCINGLYPHLSQVHLLRLRSKMVL